MIKAGAPIPSTTVKLVSETETRDVDAAIEFGQGRIVMFTVPGAFTPTCHNDHLPGFVANREAFDALGVDRIVCATVNDHHVTRAWAVSRDALGKIDFVADFNAQFAAALGLTKDLTVAGLGVRFVRAALIIENGVVREVFVRDQPGDLGATSAEAVLAALRT